MSQEDMVSMKFHREDWEIICEALGHSVNNSIEALKYYPGTPEDEKYFNDHIGKARDLTKQIQNKLGNRKKEAKYET